MPRTAEQNEEIREATRRTILESAMVLFARHGYAHTSIRKIATHANISTGLMYHYFENKEDLLKAVNHQTMVTLGEHFLKALDHSTPAERLRGVLSVIFRLLEEDRGFWELFYVLRNQPAVMAIIGEDIRRWTTRLRGIFVTEYAALGRPDPETEALILYSLVEGTVQQYLLDPENYPLQQVVERIIGTQMLTKW